MVQVNRVIFLHIPKAAGSTLNGVIERQYPRDSIYVIDAERQDAAIEEFKALPEARRAKIRLLRGHVGFGLHDYLPEPVSSFTVLRDPVDRVMSHYYYLRDQMDRGRDYTDRPWLREAGRMTLGEYVRHGPSADVRNGQTRLLAGAMNGWDVAAATPSDPTDMLDRAKANLGDQLCLAGLTERFDETLLLLQRRLGWSKPFYVTRNVTQGRPPKAALSPDELEGIQDANRLDIELYEYATARFEQAVRAEGPSFPRAVHRFRFLNRRWDEARRLRNSARYRSGMVVRRPGLGRQ